MRRNPDVARFVARYSAAFHRMRTVDDTFVLSVTSLPPSYQDKRAIQVLS
jgi:hypothetical protein